MPLTVDPLLLGDAAQTARAQNSLEKMLAHEMTATHRVIMKLIGQVNAQLEAMSENSASPSLVILEANKFLHGEICRTAGTIARLQIAQQQGMLTPQRLRSGGRRHGIRRVNDERPERAKGTRCLRQLTPKAGP
jgi:hypothetical protein